MLSSLILAHTAPKIPALARHRIKLWRSMEQEDLDPELRARNQLLWIFPEAAMEPPDAMEMLVKTVAMGLRAQSREGFAAQAEACQAFDVSDRLPEIHAPALILSARDDISIPEHHSRKLERLANVREMKIFDSAGHASHLVRSREFNRTVTAFIRTVQPRD